MNESKNNSEKKNGNKGKKCKNLLNNIILSLKSAPLKDLAELSDEFKIFSLIVEIEPDFEVIPFNNKVAIVKDANIEIRYSNFISIFNAVVNYKNESKSKDKFTRETNFLHSISITGILNHDLEQLIKISEMLCFLTIISSNKNYYIEKVNEIEDNQISNFYYSIIEKYIIFKIDESITSVVKPTNISSIDIIGNNGGEIQDKNSEQEKEKEISKESDKGNNSINCPKKLFDDLTVKEIELNNNNNIANEMQNKIDFLANELSKANENNKKLESENKLLNEIITELKELNNNLLKEKEKNNEYNQKIIVEKENTISSQLNLINSLSEELKEDKETISNLKNSNDYLIKNIEQVNLDKKEIEESLKKQISKESNYTEIISNNNDIIEKLKEELNVQTKINEKNKEEKEKEKENSNIKLETKIEQFNFEIPGTGTKGEELDRLRQILDEKEEKIKELEERDIGNTNNTDEDFNFYKKSYEEQKNKVSEEHKLISESLYKLAIHFMTLKDDLQKRINSSNNEK